MNELAVGIGILVAVFFVCAVIGTVICGGLYFVRSFFLEKPEKVSLTDKEISALAENAEQ